jgi:NADH-quinone oxidoreductase subunit L
MLFHFKTSEYATNTGVLDKWRNAFYILSIKEWNTDFILNKYLWQPFKWLGRMLRIFDSVKILPISIIACLGGIATLVFRENIHEGLKITLSHLFLFSSLFLVLRSFSERKDARNAWLLVFTSQVFTALAIFINKHFEFHQILLYLSGSIIAGVIGIICLNKLREKEGDLHLHAHRGHSHEHRSIAFVFLLACLGMSGFPITPSFLGTDILFTHVHLDQVLLISLMALNFVFVELSLIRLYIRLFTGPHRKQYHPIAFKSS